MRSALLASILFLLAGCMTPAEVTTPNAEHDERIVTGHGPELSEAVDALAVDGLYYVTYSVTADGPPTGPWSIHIRGTTDEGDTVWLFSRTEPTRLGDGQTISGVQTMPNLTPMMLTALQVSVEGVEDSFVSFSIMALPSA